MEQYKENEHLIIFSYVSKFETGECLLHYLRKEGVELSTDVEESIKDLDLGAFCNKELKLGILKADYFKGKVYGENAIVSAGLELGLVMARPEIGPLAFCKIREDNSLQVLFDYLTVIHPEIPDSFSEPACFTIDCSTFDTLLSLNEGIPASVKLREGYIFEIAEEAEPAIN